MTERLQIYKCGICGNIVEVLHPGVGELVCCGEPMGLLQEKTEDVGQEKHVPVIEQTESGTKVKVGSIPHPMEKEHYIEWIELMADGAIHRKFLGPGDQPEAEFGIKGDTMGARELCTIHGLWTSQT